MSTTTQNQVATTGTNAAARPLTAKALFERDDVKAKFQEMLGKRAPQFITSVLQIVAQNPSLAGADPTSIYQAAAVAATLDLPVNQNLGFAYIIPYNNRQKNKQTGQYETVTVAQFQMGYRGFIQLAQRSGQFKSIYASEIYEGQLVNENPLEGYEFDFKKKTSSKVIGYAAKFKLINGFEATLYMDVDQLRAHGKKYSKTYDNDRSLWKTDFDSMAKKTVLKLLLSKYAPLSVEMQKAVVADQSVVNDAETVDVTYVDNTPPVVDKEEERLSFMIQDAQTIEHLMDIKELVANYPDLAEAYETKLTQLMEAE